MWHSLVSSLCVSLSFLSRFAICMRKLHLPLAMHLEYDHLYTLKTIEAVNTHHKYIGHFSSASYFLAKVHKQTNGISF